MAAGLLQLAAKLNQWLIAYRKYKEGDRIDIKQPRKADNREYTFMLVPHQGQSVMSIKVPIKIIKGLAVAVVFLILFSVGAFVNYRYTINTARAEKVELEDLRQTNGMQKQQIEDMRRLNQLDNDVRRLMSMEEQPETSRSGIVRANNSFNGQGGPNVKPDVNDLANLVRELQANAKEREVSLNNLRSQVIDRNARAAAIPSIWPTNGDVTSRFGWRSSPWGWGSDWHPGIDIANDYGIPIAATADGTVIFADWYSGYGKLIQIDHGNGIVTLYGHNSTILVSEGQRVHKGDIIAEMGSTGDSTGPHCHYEVRVNGTAVNPASFL